jgi:hypothetical protein
VVEEVPPNQRWDSIGTTVIRSVTRTTPPTAMASRRWAEVRCRRLATSSPTSSRLAAVTSGRTGWPGGSSESPTPDRPPGRLGDHAALRPPGLVVGQHPDPHLGGASGPDRARGRGESTHHLGRMHRPRPPRRAVARYGRRDEPRRGRLGLPRPAPPPAGRAARAPIAPASPGVARDVALARGGPASWSSSPSHLRLGEDMLPASSTSGTTSTSPARSRHPAASPRPSRSGGPSGRSRPTTRRSPPTRRPCSN